MTRRAREWIVSHRTPGFIGLSLVGRLYLPLGLGSSPRECAVTTHCIGALAIRPSWIWIAPIVDGSFALDNENDGDALYLHTPLRDGGRWG